MGTKQSKRNVPDDDSGRPLEEDTFQLSEYPPVLVIIMSAIQQVLFHLNGPIAVAWIISGALCAQNKDIVFAQLLAITMFVMGVNTILQVTFGVRLPIVQGSAGAFIPPVFAMMYSAKWRCPDTPLIMNGTDEEIRLADELLWHPRLNELSGGLISASCVQVFLGCSGSIGFLVNYIGPITIIPTITLVGLSIFKYATYGAMHQWGIAMFTVALTVLFGLILADVKVPYPTYVKGKGCTTTRYPFFRIFYFILTLGTVWLFSYILTRYDVFPNDPSAIGYLARTDSKLYVLRDMEWWFWPYPGRFGTPTFGAATFVGMFAATIASIIESIGDYYATATICAVPPPPKHAINRGIVMEGLGSIIAGLLGCGHATTSYSGNVGFISITGIRSRIVWQVYGVMMILIGCIGKIAGALALVPDPIIGGMALVGTGILISVGISGVKYIDPTSSRNLVILGIAFMLGLMLPDWISSGLGRVNTGNADADNLLTVLLSTHMFIGGVVAFILDNIVPGTKDERGITGFLKAYHKNQERHSDVDDDIIKDAYDIPLISERLRRIKCCRYVPILPSFQPAECCKSCRATCRTNSTVTDSTVEQNNHAFKMDKSDVDLSNNVNEFEVKESTRI